MHVEVDAALRVGHGDAQLGREETHGVVAEVDQFLAERALLALDDHVDQLAAEPHLLVDHQLGRLARALADAIAGAAEYAPVVVPLLQLLRHSIVARHFEPLSYAPAA